MEDFHKIIIKRCLWGMHGFEEYGNYPFGAIPQEIRSIPDEDISRFMLIPAELVPESETTRNIKKKGLELEGRMVVYRPCRRGRDKTYG